MKKIRFFFSALLCMLLSVSAVRAQVITTFAGKGVIGNTGDGGPADSAELYNPVGVAIDHSGNVYISDNYENVIREVNTSGIISTICGIAGTIGYSGDGGAAVAAQLWGPRGMAVDATGNLYIADGQNYVIRVISPAGTISTFAGNGTQGYSGDGGPATAAELNNAYGVAVDDSGNVYIADGANARIRKVNTVGIITTVAGSGVAGYYGDGGMADTAELSDPVSVAADDSGNIYIADYGNNRIRKVSHTGIITTVAGSGIYGYAGDDGPPDSAQLNGPAGIAVDAAQYLYIADFNNNVIRLVAPGGMISTLAGNGINSYSGDGGAPASAELNGPSGVAVTGTSTAFIVDAFNYRIREIADLANSVRTVSSAQAVTVSPNPTAGSFNVTFPASLTGTFITVSDLCGRIFVARPADASATGMQVSLAGQPPGTYIIKLQSSTGSVVRKVVVD